MSLQNHKIVINVPRLAPEPLGMQTYFERVIESLLREAPESFDLHIQSLAFRRRAQHISRRRMIDPNGRAHWVEYPIPLTVYKRVGAFLPFELPVQKGAQLIHSLDGSVVKQPKAPLLVTLQDIIPLRANESRAEDLPAIKRFFRKAVTSASAIITISQFSKNEIVEQLDVPDDKVIVVPNGVDLDFFHPAAPQSKAVDWERLKSIGLLRPYILHLGGSAPRKNVARLVESFSILRSMQSTPLDLVLCGSKRCHDDVRDAIACSPFRDDVRMLSYVDDQTKLLLLQHAEVLAFPSLYEGFGMPPLEAMACNTPVAVSTAASLPEVAGDAAVYFNPSDPQNMAEQLHALINDIELRRVCRERGLRRAAAFTWQKNALSTLDIYRRFMAHGLPSVQYATKTGRHGA